MLLLSLVGEQPIPNLLPHLYLHPEQTFLVYTDFSKTVALRLQKILPNALPIRLKASPYRLDQILAELETLCAGIEDLAFHVTGGTKPMALAAFSLAAQSARPVHYLKSEGGKNLLYS